jgi:hypothetical protein
LVAKRPAVQSLEPKRSGCICTRSEDTLLFDCRGCAQGKDLNDCVCLKRVISALAEQTDVKEVVLSGDWESLYQDGCVRVLNGYAELVRACRTSNVLNSSQPQCASCPHEPRKLLTDISDRLPLPWDDLRRRAVAVKGRPGCYSCIASTGSIITRLDALAKEIDRTVAKEAFRIVGVSQ